MDLTSENANYDAFKLGESKFGLCLVLGLNNLLIVHHMSRDVEGRWKLRLSEKE